MPYGIAQGLEVYGIERGYCGLINGYIKRLDNRSVSGIIQHGGTMLKTDRCPEFIEKEYQQKGIDVLNAYGIEGLIVIGGDGSLRGINDLQQNFNLSCVAIQEYRQRFVLYDNIGFDTAVYRLLWAVTIFRDS